LYLAIPAFSFNSKPTLSRYDELVLLFEPLSAQARSAFSE
jgi:hypothetical protein